RRTENGLAAFLHQEWGCSKLRLRPSCSLPPLGGRRGDRAVFFGSLTSTRVARSDRRTVAGQSRPDRQDCSGQRGRTLRTGSRRHCACPQRLPHRLGRHVPGTMKSFKSGDDVTCRVQRGAKEANIKVNVGEWPREQPGDIEVLYDAVDAGGEAK